jgi:HlyD family secretion protein
LRIRTNVDQVDLGQVAKGQEVEVRSNAYPNRLWRAQITELIPRVVTKESRLVAEGLAEVAPPAEGLVPGMTVDVEIMVSAVSGALQIPAEAVFTDEDGAFVYRLRGNRVERTGVVLGRSTVTQVEVLEGLENKDSVVLGPVSGLQDGMKVDVRKHDGS